jgi:hypothetical protein
MMTRLFTVSQLRPSITSLVLTRILGTQDLVGQELSLETRAGYPHEANVVDYLAASMYKQ